MAGCSRRIPSRFYHGTSSVLTLKELVRNYNSLVEDATRVMLRIKALFSARAIRTAGRSDSRGKVRTKRNLWPYAGLAVVTRSSADEEFADGKLRRRDRAPRTRGLNRNHNPMIKSIFKGVVTAAAAKAGPLQDLYDACLARGTKPELAKVTLARKMASMSLGETSLRTSPRISVERRGGRRSREGACPALHRTLVERATGVTLIRKLRYRKAATVNKRVIDLLRRHSPLFKTIKVDNGPESHGYDEIESAERQDLLRPRGVRRGRCTNENTNGLIRQYVPKRTSMQRLTDKRCDAIAAGINNRPRKRYGFHTPLDCLADHFAIA